MASLNFDVTYKFYDLGAHPSDNFFWDYTSNFAGEYPKVIFPFSQMERLKSIKVQITPRGSASRLLVKGTVPNPINTVWNAYGRLLDLEGNPLKNGIPKYVPFIDDALVFTVPDNRILVDTYNNEYKPNCEYIGGFELQEVFVYWNSFLTPSNNYILRCRVSFEFEV